MDSAKEMRNRGLRSFILLIGLVASSLIFGPAGFTQDEGPDKQDVKFQFRDASVDAFLRYVAEVTGMQIVSEFKIEGTITAFSDAEIPIGQVLEFVETILNSKGATLERVGKSTLKVVSLEDARKRGVMVVKDPAKIPANDQTMTIVIPLNHIKVAEIWPMTPWGI